MTSLESTLFRASRTGHAIPPFSRRQLGNQVGNAITCRDAARNSRRPVSSRPTPAWLVHRRCGVPRTTRNGLARLWHERRPNDPRPCGETERRMAACGESGGHDGRIKRPAMQFVSGETSIALRLGPDAINIRLELRLLGGDVNRRPQEFLHG